MDDGKGRGIVCAILAVAMFSTSPVFVRWAGGLSPLVVTCLRMLVGSVAVLGIAAARHQVPSVPREDWPRFALWGLIAALHFGLYIASLGYTTVAHSLSLVYTSPVWVSLCTRLFLRETLPRRKWTGILVALVGMGILSGFEPVWTWRMLAGDLMAIGSAVAFGFYSIAGRSQRTSYPLLTYASGVYGMAALWLLPPAVLTFRVPQRVGLTLLSIICLGVFPLAIGHTLYNAALRRLHPTLVNVIATQEVTGGVLLSWWLLQERPSVSAILGAVVMLAGVVQVVV